MYAQVEKPKNKNKKVTNSVVQKKNNRKQGVGLFDNHTEIIVQKKENNVRLPNNLKSGVENLSAFDRENQPTSLRQFNNKENTIQTKRVVPDDEWAKYKKKKKNTKIRGGTKIGDLSVTDAYRIFDEYKKKGERFKKGKKKVDDLTIEDKGFRSENKILRHKIGNYIFLGLLIAKENKVILLATRGQGTGKNPILWREEEIKEAEVQKNDAPFRVEYKNEYSLTDGILKASYNFANHDDRRYGPFEEGGTYTNKAGETEYGISSDEAEYLNRTVSKGKRIKNSEILFYQMELAQKLAGKNSADFTKLTTIHRENVINNDTLFVMGLCYGARFNDDGEVEKGDTDDQRFEEYFAILGTPNGQAVGYIAQQHTGDVGNPIDHITKIVRENTQLMISITLGDD